MPYMLIVVLLLAGCATPLPASKPQAINCPASVAVPAPLVGVPTAKKVGELQIRGELAREAERARGDCWRAAAGER